MITETIKKAMDARGIMAKTLAEHIGVTRSSMSLFLNGKRAMGQKKIEEMFSFLGIELTITRPTDKSSDM